jgi:hypothetical protein
MTSIRDYLTGKISAESIAKMIKNGDLPLSPDGISEFKPSHFGVDVFLNDGILLVVKDPLFYSLTAFKADGVTPCGGISGYTAKIIFEAADEKINGTFEERLKRSISESKARLKALKPHVY